MARMIDAIQANGTGMTARIRAHIAFVVDGGGMERRSS
jgi:hypothetical protein